MRPCCTHPSGFQTRFSFLTATSRGTRAHLLFSSLIHHDQPKQFCPQLRLVQSHHLQKAVNIQWGNCSPCEPTAKPSCNQRCCDWGGRWQEGMQPGVVSLVTQCYKYEVPREHSTICLSPGKCAVYRGQLSSCTSRRAEQILEQGD